MPEIALLRVGVRMLLDVLKVFDDKNDKEDWECGCKCKTPEVAEGLHSFLSKVLEGFPAQAVLKGGEENVVSIVRPAPAPELPALSSDTPVDVSGQ
jgi:hypothetical protein